MGANIGAGQTMGQQLGKGIGAQAGQAKAGITQAEQKFQTAKREAEEKARSAIGAVGQYGQDGMGDLSGMSEEEAKKIREQFQSGSKYTGPAGLAEERQLAARAGALQNIATGALSGPTGQAGLMRSMMTGPGTYTRGQSYLDTALIGQSEAGKRAIQSAAQQAMGAKQNIASSIASAKEQALAAQAGLGEEKKKAETGAIEKLKGIQAEGTEQAKQFLGKGERLKELLTGKDELGNDITFSPDDELLLSQLEEFGINPNAKFMLPTTEFGQLDKETQDYARNEMASILKEIANRGKTTFQSSMANLSEEQRNAARNLALLTGQTDLAKNIQETQFDKNLFNASPKAVQEMAGAKKLQEYVGNQKNIVDDVTNVLSKYQKMQTGNIDPRNITIGYDSAIRGSFVGEAKRLLGGDAVNKIREKYFNQFPGPFQGLAEKYYLNEVAREVEKLGLKANQIKESAKETTLKDYLQNLYAPKTTVKEAPGRKMPKQQLTTPWKPIENEYEKYLGQQEAQKRAAEQIAATMPQTYYGGI
jgi:hypothetical protein